MSTLAKKYLRKSHLMSGHMLRCALHACTDKRVIVRNNDCHFIAKKWKNTQPVKVECVENIKLR